MTISPVHVGYQSETVNSERSQKRSDSYFWECSLHAVVGFFEGWGMLFFQMRKLEGGGVGGEGTYWRQWTSKSNFTVDVSRRKKIVLFSEHVSHRLPTPTFTNTSNLRPTRNQREKQKRRRKKKLLCLRHWLFHVGERSHIDILTVLTHGETNTHEKKEQSLQHDRTECCLLSRPPPSLTPPHTHIRKHQTCLNVCVCFTATNS